MLIADSNNAPNTSLVIAFHADGTTAGGLAAFIRHLSKKFREQGHKIALFVNHFGPFSEEMSQYGQVYSFEQRAINNPGINLGQVRIPDPVAAIKNYVAMHKNRQRISDIIRLSNADVVLGNGIYSAATIGTSCSKLGIPLILCVHGIGRRSNDLLSIRARISARILNQADLVVGVSKVCLQRYLPYLKVPTKTIYNCCSPVVTTKIKPEFLEQKKLPPDTTLVGSFGRIMHDKGYHVLIRAVSRINPEHRPAIVIGGKPLNETEFEYLAELKRLANELEMEDRCFFIGEVTPDYFFSVIDIFCHTYLGEENLSYAILEAMSASCPVIAVDLGGPREMIEHGVSGQLVAPDDPDLLSAAIEKYLIHPESAGDAARNGLKRIQEIFNFDDWPAKWLAQIEECRSKTAVEVTSNPTGRIL